MNAAGKLSEGDRDRLIKALNTQQTRLKGILDLIEKQDVSAAEVRDQLGWVAEAIRDIRKAGIKTQNHRR